MAEFAETLEQLDVARRAWRVALDNSPSLGAYQNLKRLAGDDWASLGPQLMLNTEEYLSARAQRGSRAKFEAALDKVADVEPEDRDRL